MSIEERLRLTELRQLTGFCLSIPRTDQHYAWRLQLEKLAKRANDILDEVTKA